MLDLDLILTMAAKNTEMFVNDDGIVVDGEGEVIIVGGCDKQVAEKKTGLVNPKYWGLLDAIDEEAGSSGEDFEQQPQKLRTPKKAGRPKAKSKSSSNRGRPIVNKSQWATDCQNIFDYLENGTNPHPKGGNQRRELPRTAKRYFVKNGQLFLMKESRVTDKKEILDRTDLSEFILFT